MAPCAKSKKFITHFPQFKEKAAPKDGCRLVFGRITPIVANMPLSGCAAPRDTVAAVGFTLSRRDKSLFEHFYAASRKSATSSIISRSAHNMLIIAVAFLPLTFLIFAVIPSSGPELTSTFCPG